MAGDLVLYNGSILTMDRQNPRVSAIGIRQGRIVATGSDEEVRHSTGPGVEAIDLRGRTATPGLNDAHSHPMAVGLALADVDIANPPCSSIAEIVESIRKKVAVTNRGGWIVGRGYDQGRLADRRHPTRHDLDAISPDHPMLLIRACHHIGVANSAALRIAGVDRNTPDPEGGSIDRDASGDPTGVLRETAYESVRANVGQPGREQMVEALRLGGSAFLATGVTSTAEAGIFRAEELAAYQAAWQQNILPVRTYLMMIIDVSLESLISLGIRTGFGNDRLRIGPAKLFSDGSIGGHTARMRDPYLGTDGSVGLWMQDPQEMKARILQAHRAGFQLGIHAIGDAAIDVILDGYEEAQRAYPRPDPRHRIEHCSIVDEATIQRIASLGVIPIPGTSFLHYFRESYVRNLGMKRLRHAYGMATFQRYGIVAAASTDAPVVPVSATTGLQTMMTRRDISGEAVWPEEAISLQDALRAYTVNGAYASFEESLKGTLAPGMLGDVAVFETDLEQVPSDEIGKTKIDHTILEGDVVYSGPAS